MKRLLVFLLLALVIHPLSATEAPVITDDFVKYMKAVLNPHDFGLRDGRFHPYSTRYGRRIGYGRPVDDKSLYARGETPAEAEQLLRAGLAATLETLRARLARTHPEHPFGTLDPRSREILLDRAYTDGVDNLPAPFLAAVLAGNWDALLDGHLHVRAPDNWPDSTRNHAFALRWIYGETGTPLRPLKKTVR